MGAALREAWLWVLLAFLLGLAIGYFVRQQPVRVRATTSRTSAGNPTTPRIAAFEASAPAAIVVPVEPPIAKASAATAPRTPTAPTAPAAPGTPTAPRTPTPPRTPTAPAAPARKAPGERATTIPASRKPSARAAALDLAAAKATLGVTVRLDDLKLIEGIGPKIETLFKADGITSWRELSKANVERLQGVLDAAGPRYKVQDPASWPRQAGLLAKGKWTEFKTLTDKLKDGR
jgi:predicted flap endonuclease-1-like 5' DNA nuclease